MADNETNYNEILYNFGIDGSTVWSSHDADGNLISQRIYEEYDDDTFHAVCDIPCYPTGLFLHLDISGLRSHEEHQHPLVITTLVREDFRIDYRPFSGILKVFGWEQISISEQEVDVTDTLNLNIQYIWGSCVPKTYCANGKTIFGYHDFKWKKIDDYDLKEKWYIGKFKTYRPEKDTSLNSSGTGIMPSGQTTTTVEIDCPADWNGSIFDFSVDCSVTSGSVRYNGYTFEQKSIVMEFTWPQAEMGDRKITFDYTFKYKTKSIPCNELQSISNIIFMDPNLWCFTTRTVNKNQTDEDIVRYPMYKAEDVDDQPQAIYLLNTKGLEGTYDFLSVTGKSYTYTKDDQYYEGFNYGYMSNAPQGILFDKDGQAVTIKKWPANDGVVNILSIADNNNSSYYNKTSPFFKAFLVSRYGIKGTATKAMIQDSPFAKDQEDNTKWLMEGKNEETNLLYQRSYSNFHKIKPIISPINKGFTALIDQFHCLCQDTVYRLPLNWKLAAVYENTIITNVSLDNVANFTENGYGNSSYLSLSWTIDDSWTYKPNIPTISFNTKPFCKCYEITNKILDRSQDMIAVKWKYNIKDLTDYLSTSDDPDDTATNVCLNGCYKNPNDYKWGITEVHDFYVTLTTYHFLDFYNYSIASPFSGQETKIKSHNINNKYVEISEEILDWEGSTVNSQNVTRLKHNENIASNYIKGNNKSYLLYFLFNFAIPGVLVDLNGRGPEHEYYTAYYHRWYIKDRNNVRKQVDLNRRNTLTGTNWIINGQFISSLICEDSWNNNWDKKDFKYYFNAIPLVARTNNYTADNFLPGIRKNGSVYSGVYTQFFNVETTTPYFYLVAWTDNKTLIEKEKILRYEYSSNGIIPIEIDTGFTQDDSVYDLTASTGSNWPKLEGSVKLINSKHIIKGNLTFSDGGPSSGTAIITLKYKTYK